MFRKLLVANRGAIAVRILRTCRELEIPSVAIYEPQDITSLHVRFADECFLLEPPATYFDISAILHIVQKAGVDAVHPGYGYLAEQASLAHACEGAGISYIGPPSGVTSSLCNRWSILEEVQRSGVNTPELSTTTFHLTDIDRLHKEAEELGFPLVLKTCQSGPGRSSWMAHTSEQLDLVVQRAERDLATYPLSAYESEQFFLEKAILPVHHVRVQVLGDRQGHILQLGERDGSIQFGFQKLMEESPSPFLQPESRKRIQQTAVSLARRFDLSSTATVEFLVDEQGQEFFTEIKPSIQVGHAVTEMSTGVDIVAEQIRVAAGYPLNFTQAGLAPRGWAMQCRIHAVDPQRSALPSPGIVRHVRWPAGANVRVDSHVTCGYEVSTQYDPALAKIICWAPTRQECVRRMRRALQEINLAGALTDLPLHRFVLDHARFECGEYDSQFLIHEFEKDSGAMFMGTDKVEMRDMAAATSTLFLRRRTSFEPVVPERLKSGWHRNNRRFGS